MLTVLVTAWLATDAWSARAADCVLGLCLGPTTTTTTEAGPPGFQLPDDTSTGLDAPDPDVPSGATPPAPEGAGPQSPSGGPPQEPPPEAAPLSGEGDDTATPSAGAGPFPADLQRMTDSVRRSGPSDTQALIEALAPLGRFGLGPDEAALIGFGRFPVAGEASYVHDWWFPRFGPGWRLHQGTDVFAAAGTPVRAPADGRVRLRDGGLGGTVVYVVEPDGTYYYLAHLQGRAEGLAEGDPVRAGQLVGYVGSSGNAGGGASHLHIEVHPDGGPAVDPKGILDGWLADALAAAPSLIESYELRGEPQLPAPPWPWSSPAERAEAPRSAYLWAASAHPIAGAMRLAELEAQRVAAMQASP